MTVRKSCVQMDHRHHDGNNELVLDTQSWFWVEEKSYRKSMNLSRTCFQNLDLGIVFTGGLRLV
ncbi:hypothetical protein HanIR_Chr13g0664271 [Helianthus annuus]|nr:hypothetical protein HanIR_Chr13g0664271 [Helianthus annuus]